MGLKKEQIAEIRADILYFLYRNNYWQNRHTPKINICNKLSQHPCKEINTGLKKLYKDKLIRYKKTNHGDDVYLNIHEKSKIEEEIKDKDQMIYVADGIVDFTFKMDAETSITIGTDLVQYVTDHDRGIQFKLGNTDAIIDLNRSIRE